MATALKNEESTVEEMFGKKTAQPTTEEKAIAQFKEVLLTISNLDELKSMEESSDTFTKEEMALITAKRKELTKK